MDDLKLLIATERIKRLKANYFIAVDLRDWTLLGEVFSDDVECDYRGSAIDPATGLNAAPAATGDVLHGKAAAIASLRDSLEGVVSFHLGGMPSIEIIDDHHARGTWSMTDTLRLPPGAPYAELTGYGHYHERYRLEDGAWRIGSLKLVRVRVDVQPWP